MIKVLEKKRKLDRNRLDALTLDSSWTFQVIPLWWWYGGLSHTSSLQVIP